MAGTARHKSIGGIPLVFSSNIFLFFYLPTVLALYYLTPRRYRNTLLFLVNLVFYGWGEPVFLLLMLFSILSNYAYGLLIQRYRRQVRAKRMVLVASVVVNLGLLGFFKYADFIAGMMQAVFPFLRTVPLPAIPLPIGISFYVFQTMSYTIDVYRGDAPVQRRLIPFGTYVSLFPQLIAGPIVRYRDVAEQMEDRRESVSQFADGIRRFTVGLGKKILIANQMGLLWDLLREEGSGLGAWIGLTAFAFQIYFDFSGYSDMAIGLGKMLGFTFLENFNYPYISRSITEFWRRWHISLSTWFREYVYIPLGGNRRGLPRQLWNILVVWALTGLWHGASWNFLLWGLYFALLLMIEKLFLLRWLDRAPLWLGHLYTLFFLLMGWALFFFTSLPELWAFLGRLFGGGAVSPEGRVDILGYLPLLLVAVVASTPFGSRVYGRIRDTVWGRYGAVGLGMAALVLCVAALASQSYNPFIYFRF